MILHALSLDITNVTNVPAALFLYVLNEGLSARLALYMYWDNYASITAYQTMHTQYEYILVLIKGVAYQTSLA